MKMKQNNISKLVTAAKVLKDAILLRVNLESFSWWPPLMGGGLVRLKRCLDGILRPAWPRR